MERRTCLMVWVWPKDSATEVRLATERLRGGEGGGGSEGSNGRIGGGTSVGEWAEMAEEGKAHLKQRHVGHAPEKASPLKG
jgi:hypothetical protein